MAKVQNIKATVCEYDLLISGTPFLKQLREVSVVPVKNFRSDFLKLLHDYGLC
jgi:hypothetical protein